MILLSKCEPTENDKKKLSDYISKYGVSAEYFYSAGQAIIKLSGATFALDENVLKSFPFVERVFETSEPFHFVSRTYKKEDTVIGIKGEKGECKAEIGGGNFTFIAGPCAVESYEQITSLAKKLKSFGVTVLRGGAFKPRTSPYTFQGLNEEGIELMKEAKRLTGLPVISEIPGESALKYFDDVDILQIGARNMQNYALLREIGGISKPVMLKRGVSATIREWLLSAEYIMKYGNENVILCERGIRTFDTETRGTIDFSAVAIVKEKSHLPVIVDPSNSTGVPKSLRRPKISLVSSASSVLCFSTAMTPAFTDTGMLGTVEMWWVPGRRASHFPLSQVQAMERTILPLRASSLPEKTLSIR